MSTVLVFKSILVFTSILEKDVCTVILRRGGVMAHGELKMICDDSSRYRYSTGF